MVKPARLDREYFVVLLPEGKLKTEISILQQRLADYYDLYQDEELPELHITLDRISKEKLLQASEIITEVVNDFTGKIKLELEDITCLQQMNDNFLVLKLKRTQSLEEFARALHVSLKAEGISTLVDYSSWDYHITLVNNKFVENPISDFDFNNLCDFAEGQSQRTVGRAGRIEIWKPTLETDKKVAYSRDLT